MARRLGLDGARRLGICAPSRRDRRGPPALRTSVAGAYERYEARGPFGQPWASGGSASALATDLQDTDQRSFEGSLGSLFFYQCRWYSPVVGGSSSRTAWC